MRLGVTGGGASCYLHLVTCGSPFRASVVGLRVVGAPAMKQGNVTQVGGGSRAGHHQVYGVFIHVHIRDWGRQARRNTPPTVGVWTGWKPPSLHLPHSTGCTADPPLCAAFPWRECRLQHHRIWKQGIIQVREGSSDTVAGQLVKMHRAGVGRNPCAGDAAAGQDDGACQQGGRGPSVQNRNKHRGGVEARSADAAGTVCVWEATGSGWRHLHVPLGSHDAESTRSGWPTV